MKIKNKIIGVITSIVLINCGMSVLATGFDINADNKIDVNDVTYLQNALSDFTEDTKLDLNSDGRIDVNDVSFLQIEISNQSVENNTQISISTKEYCKNVGDTFTISVDTNNDVNEITFTSSDSSVAKIISTEKSLAKVKVNKVGNATVTVKQCRETVTAKIKVEKARCVDLSEWNGDIDFNKVKKSGVTCVILRAGYGKDDNQEDEKFNEYYAKAKTAGLNVGAYWYSYATTIDAAKAEVRNCMKTIRGKEFDLPVFLDVEEYRQAVLPRRTLTDIISTFCDGIKSNGFESGLYSAKSMLVDSAYPDELASKYLIWMAAPNNSYNELPSFVDIHQYSWTGRFDGISEKVDMNYIYNLNY
ncbi:GH25 family lysozyme [uncultured Ruminococcus sp.]|uniref:GH25 family lysozyme n=1 Tax=uncultured Ruminococcus sp. TaxID=165186 RepID=UPI00266F716E|nr:GH25 family lysozyme [uncultured Ruminococcus sp.]